MNKHNFKSYIALIGSMLIFGTLGVVRRYVPLSSAMLALCRGVLGSVFLLVFVLVRGGKLKLPERKATLWLVLTGAVMGLNWMLLFEAYNYTTVAAATMCYYMQPTIVILLSPIVFRERLGAKRLACAFAAIVGMLFVSGVLSGGVGQVHIGGILFGLGAAAFYATVIILNKKIVVGDIYAKTIIQLAGAALVMICAADRGRARPFDERCRCRHGAACRHRSHGYHLRFVFRQHAAAQGADRCGLELYRPRVCAAFVGCRPAREPHPARNSRRSAHHRLCDNKRDCEGIEKTRRSKDLRVFAFLVK